MKYKADQCMYRKALISTLTWLLLMSQCCSFKTFVKRKKGVFLYCGRSWIFIIEFIQQAGQVVSLLLSKGKFQREKSSNSVTDLYLMIFLYEHQPFILPDLSLKMGLNQIN